MLLPVSVCLLVCQQDYTKTSAWISMTLGWMMAFGQDQIQIRIKGRLLLTFLNILR